jgi:hypothetical protein
MNRGEAARRVLECLLERGKEAEKRRQEQRLPGVLCWGMLYMWTESGAWLQRRTSSASVLSARDFCGLGLV